MDEVSDDQVDELASLDVENDPERHSHDSACAHEYQIPPDLHFDLADLIQEVDLRKQGARLNEHRAAYELLQGELPLA